MRAGYNPFTEEYEIYLTEAEAKQMQEMVRGANLPLRRVFNELLDEL